MVQAPTKPLRNQMHSVLNAFRFHANFQNDLHHITPGFRFAPAFLGPAVSVSAKNAPLFSTFPSRLSRACLGKMIVFIYKRSKEGVFRTASVRPKNVILVLVPSLSW